MACLFSSLDCLSGSFWEALGHSWSFLGRSWGGLGRLSGILGELLGCTSGCRFAVGAHGGLGRVSGESREGLRDTPRVFLGTPAPGNHCSRVHEKANSGNYGIRSSIGSWTRFVPLWRVSPDHFVSHLASLGRSWGGLGRLLGALGALLACYLTHLGALGRSAGALELSWGTLGALGGRSRVALGFFLGALGALSGTLDNVALSGRSEGAFRRYGVLFDVLGFVLGPLGFMSMIFWIFLRGFF